MKKTLFAALALSLFLFAVSAFSVPQVGAEKGLSEGSLFVETEIDSRYNGQIVAAGLLEAEGKTITISASDTAVTGLHLEGKGNTVRITGERVTLENCSLAGAETVVTGKGFFAVRCDFDDLTFAAEAADAEAARCVIEGAVSLYGRNQVLYGNRCGAVEADGAANLSVVKNEGESVTVRNASFVNLSGNSWKKEVSFDDRAALWGSDLGPNIRAPIRRVFRRTTRPGSRQVPFGKRSMPAARLSPRTSVLRRRRHRRMRSLLFPQESIRALIRLFLMTVLISP